MKRGRDHTVVETALKALTDCAAGKGGNLMQLSVEVVIRYHHANVQSVMHVRIYTIRRLKNLLFTVLHYF